MFHASTIGSSREQFTVVINTFKRHDMLQDAVAHYSTCEFVKHIYIVWCESLDPTADLKSKFSSIKAPTVDFSIHRTDSLNHRFSPLSGPHTDAIFAVDDDIRVPCTDLRYPHKR